MIKFVFQGGCKWSIGSGENINIWEQNWLKEGVSHLPNQPICNLLVILQE
jgi:hypothetical protein